MRGTVGRMHGPAHTGILLLALLAGCSQPTRIVVEVVAEEGVLTGGYERTHIAVEALDACGERPAGTEVLTRDVDQRDPRYAVARVLLTPCENRADRRYEVVATADREVVPRTIPPSYTPFVVTRAVSGYVAGQTRVLRLTLQASCRDVLICADDQTCADAACVPAGIDQNLLPRLGDGARDASGIDAAPIDASAPIDAPEPMDAFQPIDVDETPDPDAHVASDASAPDAHVASDAYAPPDAHAPPDAYEPSDAYRTCRDIYGAAAGFTYCGEGPDSCTFWTSGDCDTACSDFGGVAPTGCVNDVGDPCGFGPTAPCSDIRIICVCPR